MSLIIMGQDLENLQVKMLRQLPENEISTRKKGNLAKYESFEEELSRLQLN